MRVPGISNSVGSRQSGAWRLLAMAALAAPLVWMTADRTGAQGPQAPPMTRLPSLVTKSAPARSCESLAQVTLPDTTIASAVLDPGTDARPPSCRVEAVVTNPPAGDRIRIWIGLPMTEWNGRFLGVGGGGFSGGNPNGVNAPVAAGYVAGSTDTGHEGGRGSFALDAQNRLNWQLIRDNAYLGVHAMTVTGKALAREFYGQAPAKSYWSGCSTGGRQGLVEAQRYPGDYDGILAGAPAINWSELHVEQMWAHVVMLETNTVVAPCKYAAATEAAVAACDANDGVTDGVIGNPRQCTYSASALVGRTTECGAITEADANVIQKIWEGPRRRDGSFLWYGLPRGASFMGLSGTGGDPLEGRPNQITLDYWRYFLKQDPNWDWKTLTPAAYEQAWAQSLEQYGPVLGSNDPNLAPFRARGGRILMWHGEVDQLIYPEGSIDYFERVRREMGGADATSSFMRFYLAPGVAHCAGGPGPQPTGLFEALVKWVEDGVAPDTLLAVSRGQDESPVRSRPLCQYPLVARYAGSGSTDEADNFRCEAGY